MQMSNLHQLICSSSSRGINYLNLTTLQGNPIHFNGPRRVVKAAAKSNSNYSQCTLNCPCIHPMCSAEFISKYNNVNPMFFQIFSAIQSKRFT